MANSGTNIGTASDLLAKMLGQGLNFYTFLPLLSIRLSQFSLGRQTFEAENLVQCQVFYPLLFL